MTSSRAVSGAVSAPIATAEGQNIGPCCGAGFKLTGGQGAVTKWGRGSCPTNKVLMIEKRTERGADRPKKHLGKQVRRPTARTTRGGCMSKRRPLYAQSASRKSQEKPPSGGRLRARRTEDLSGLSEREGGSGYTSGSERRQKRPPTDAGPARKALLPLIRPTFA
ncbi:hypothetical protein ABE25_02125 [Cytobacillus firmus]|nr:hypothetical protein [Cytobacillus firmus]MBG9601058.1 hypothetical protein [Cytobacillus firmus]